MFLFSHLGMWVGSSDLGKFVCTILEMGKSWEMKNMYFRAGKKQNKKKKKKKKTLWFKVLFSFNIFKMTFYPCSLSRKVEILMILLNFIMKIFQHFRNF